MLAGLGELLAGVVARVLRRHQFLADLPQPLLDKGIAV